MSVAALPVSIVIPARNRNRVLQLMAPTYFRQGCAELIVVDDASDPPLDPIEPNGATAVKWIRLDRRANAQMARMAGVRVATQPYVFFGEDDVFLSDGCIECLLDNLRRGLCTVAAPPWVTVKQLPGEALVFDERRTVTEAAEIVNYRVIQLDNTCQPVVPIEVPWLSTLALLSRETILKIGFDPAYQGNAYREETDFFVRAHAAGERLALVPSPLVYHYKGLVNTNSLKELLRLPYVEFWVARNNYYFLRKNRLALEKCGASARPFRDTALLVGRRLRWYWRRAFKKLFYPAEKSTATQL